jgi:hypothetical protein
VRSWIVQPVIGPLGKSKFRFVSPLPNPYQPPRQDRILAETEVTKVNVATKRLTNVVSYELPTLWL